MSDQTLDSLPNPVQDKWVLTPRAAAFLVVSLVALIIFSRLWQLTTHPAVEWDEPVYFSVASNLFHDGSLAMKLPVGSEGHYLYHPPLYFGILAFWFGIVGDSLGAARVLTAGASVATLGLLYTLLRTNPGGCGAWVILGMIAADGWLVFSARIALIENLMLLIAVLGLLLYRWANESNLIRSRRMAGFILAGATLGTAATFKHTGAFMILVLPIHWALVRKHGRHHLAGLAAAAAVIIGYLVTMTLVFGREFWDQYGLQFSRAVGALDSRGSVGGLDALQAVAGSYVVFAGTILAAAAGLILVASRLLLAARQRSLEVLRGPSSLYLAWTLAALTSSGLIAIRFPQYMLLVLLPLFMYSGSEALIFIRAHRTEHKWSVAGLAGLMVIIVGMSSFAFGSRILLEEDNAIMATVDYIASHYAPDTLVLTEEPIGVLIPQPYLSLELWAVGVDRIPPRVIVTYTSLTQDLPRGEDLASLVENATRVIQFEGFKETITVYEVGNPPGGTG